jgi:hypothetical protein
MPWSITGGVPEYKRSDCSYRGSCAKPMIQSNPPNPSALMESVAAFFSQNRLRAPSLGWGNWVCGPNKSPLLVGEVGWRLSSVALRREMDSLGLLKRSGPLSFFL